MSITVKQKEELTNISKCVSKINEKQNQLEEYITQQKTAVCELNKEYRDKKDELVLNDLVDFNQEYNAVSYLSSDYLKESEKEPLYYSFYPNPKSLETGFRKLKTGLILILIGAPIFLSSSFMSSSIVHILLVLLSPLLIVIGGFIVYGSWGALNALEKEKEKNEYKRSYMYYLSNSFFAEKPKFIDTFKNLRQIISKIKTPVVELSKETSKKISVINESVLEKKKKTDEEISQIKRDMQNNEISKDINCSLIDDILRYIEYNPDTTLLAANDYAVQKHKERIRELEEKQRKIREEIRQVEEDRQRMLDRQAFERQAALDREQRERDARLQREQQERIARQQQEENRKIAEQAQRSSSGDPIRQLSNQLGYGNAIKGPTISEKDIRTAIKNLADKK